MFVNRKAANISGLFFFSSNFLASRRIMHPVIRIICFLIVSGFVVFGGVYELALGMLVVASVVLIKRFQSLELSLRIIKRMKLFFISILVLYLWFTPGAPVMDVPVPGIPTVEGIKTGLLRVLSLVLVIFAVNYFVTAIARSSLVEAIVWLLHPVQWLGVDNKTIALRIALVLELIPRVQNIVLDVKQGYQEKSSQTESKKNITGKKKLIAKLAVFSQLVEQLFVRVVDEAVNAPQETIELGGSSNPPALQWTLPIVLAAMFFWVSTL